METPAADLAARVRAQYEAFPYPAYGLFLPLRGQEAYASHSLFAARLLEQRGQTPAARRLPAPAVLLAGCGDVFPYLASFWEPRRHRLIAMDLSARSLRRARLRCLPRLRGLEWLRADLGDEEAPLPEGLAHVDCYGVLHHLARPAAALRRLGGLLAPGGTARIMVYNSEARGWIRHLQKAFALLGLDGAEAGDRDAALALLRTLAEASPALRSRLEPMRDVLSHPARFIDTFFHAREARLGADYWYRAIADAGLAILGLYDRYGELDDLPNPLLEAPAEEALRERIADRRFENNLELFLARADDGLSAGPGSDAAPGPAGARGLRGGIHGRVGAHGRSDGPGGAPAPVRLPAAHSLRAPPRAWWGYRETCKLPWDLRLGAWAHFLANVSGRRAPADAWAGRLPPRALQRLGRLGVILPDECGSAELKALLRSPLEAAMEPPDFPPRADLRGNRELGAYLEGLLRDGADRKAAGAGRGGKDAPREDRIRAERRLDPVWARLDAAQRP
jgi:SAM-dependent methyltransferase